MAVKGGRGQLCDDPPAIRHEHRFAVGHQAEYSLSLFLISRTPTALMRSM